MRKCFRLVIIMSAVFLGLMGASIGLVAKLGMTVTVEELNGFGDKSAADGLQINIPVSGLEDHLVWETEHVFGDRPKTQTKIDFSNMVYEKEWKLSEIEPVTIDIYAIGNDENRPDWTGKQEVAVSMEPWDRLNEVYDDVWSRKLPGNTGYVSIAQIGLSDYYEYYPLFVEGTARYRFSGVDMDTLERTKYILNGMIDHSLEQILFRNFGYWAEDEASDDPINNLCRGIRYRILPEYSQEAYVWISSDRAGEIQAYRFNLLCDGWLTNVPIPVPVNTYSVSAATDADVYYALDLRLTEGGRPASEAFESGYGVWKIGYKMKNTSADIKLTFTEKEPEMIYEIDPEETLLELVASKDNKYLYLFTAKDGIYLLTVIDLQGEMAYQRLELATYDKELKNVPEIGYVFQGENVVAPIVLENQIVVISIDESGKHERQYVIDEDTDRQRTAIRYLNEIYSNTKTVTHWDRDPVSVELAYRDGKLAMIYSLTNSYGTRIVKREETVTSCFWVGVYDKNGLAYAGEYMMSQGDELRDICEIRDDVEIGISWGE